jgi:hypothetical protein
MICTPRPIYVIRVFQPRRIRWEEHVASMGERRDAYRVLVGKPEGKRPFGTPKHRWEDNIKIYGEVWIGLIRLRTGTCASVFEYGNDPRVP